LHQYITTTKDIRNYYNSRNIKEKYIMGNSQGNLVGRCVLENMKDTTTPANTPTVTDSKGFKSLDEDSLNHTADDIKHKPSQAVTTSKTVT
jgi:hypothetical protein